MASIKKPITILMIFGTRPEAIKMAPLAKVLNENQNINFSLCVTAQHREMLDQVLKLFNLKPDFDLNLMKTNQSLTELTSSMLINLDKVIAEAAPDLIIVHGDTTTTFSASLAGYYRKVPIAHVEAGLRTGNMYSPWPEEANRKLTGSLATLHFAPTEQAKSNLLKEATPDTNIHVTGNTVIDALLWTKETIERNNSAPLSLASLFPQLRQGSRMVLITGHRRENFGEPFKQICDAIRQLSCDFQDVDFVYPVHLNPNVRGPVQSILSGCKNIYLIEPQEYLPFVWLMLRSSIIMTDSGGIQEEAPALGKPVLVMRDTTERPEAIACGAAKLVGTSREKICTGVSTLLNNPTVYKEMAKVRTPYGDGKASSRIVNHILSYYS